MLDCSTNSGLGVQSSSPSRTASVAVFMAILPPLSSGISVRGAATASGQARQPFEHPFRDRAFGNLPEMEIEAAKRRAVASVPEIVGQRDPMRKAVEHHIRGDHESQI